MDWKKIITISTGIVALVFYALCWFTHQPTAILHNIGISLPWLSLILSIGIGFVLFLENNYFSLWGYVYAISTIIYVIAVSILEGSILQQLPHLLSCVFFIIYFILEKTIKRLK